MLSQTRKKKKIVEKLKSYVDSSSFSGRQRTGFENTNFPSLIKDVSGLKLINCIDQDLGKLFSILQLS